MEANASRLSSFSSEEETLLEISFCFSLCGENERFSLSAVVYVQFR
jgi:hypothetical protein